MAYSKRPPKRLETLLFHAGFATLITHEMDAVMQAEWRLLFGLRSLPEPTAAALFIALHVPVVTALLWVSHHPNWRVKNGSRLALMLFLAIHAILHYRLIHHADYSFYSGLSTGLIYGGGLLGVVYLVSVVSIQFRRSGK